MKFNFDFEKAFIEQFLEREGNVIFNEEFVGNGTFLIKREHAGFLVDLIEILDAYDREIPVTECRKKIPSVIEGQYTPTKMYAGFVADDTRPMNTKYYWLFTEKMGFTIHGSGPKKPHALVKDGQIVGVCMLMNPDILEAMAEVA